MIKKLAKIKEEQGLIAEAADLMQEIAVSSGGLIWCNFLICIRNPPMVELPDLSPFSLYMFLIINLCRWKLLVPWQKLRKLHSFLNKYVPFFGCCICNSEPVVKRTTFFFWGVGEGGGGGCGCYKNGANYMHTWFEITFLRYVFA